MGVPETPRAKSQETACPFMAYGMRERYLIFNFSIGLYRTSQTVPVYDFFIYYQTTGQVGNTFFIRESRGCLEMRICLGVDLGRGVGVSFVCMKIYSFIECDKRLLHFLKLY